MEQIINGQTYQIGAMSTMSQLKVARRLGPALPILQGLTAEANQGKDPTLLTVLMLSKLSDEDTDVVMYECLASVARRQESGWASVYVKGALMFSDMDLRTLLLLTTQVIQENLGDFFRTALASLEGQKVPK